MSDADKTANLPAQIAEAIVAIPKGLTPATIKALDRLIGAAVDVPVAWLGQHKAKIEAQTEAYKLVEAAIAKAAASEAGADQATVQRAMNVLVRKEYRKQTNRDAVAIAMIEDLSLATDQGEADTVLSSNGDVDDDWLNVFERYVEDASSERMQKLWGRVLAGEVRRPGRFSTRTLRFLSEFSQADAFSFEVLCRGAFGDAAPRKLAIPNEHNIRHLIYLEANGLIQGATGLGLSRKLHFNEKGCTSLREGNLAILFKGAANSSVSDPIVALTPLGQELVSLLPGRDARAAARDVAHAMRVPAFEEAYLGLVDNNTITPIETLWLKEPSKTRDVPESMSPQE